MLTAVRNRDFRALCKIGPSKLSQPDGAGRTVLHILANNHELDLLFACICMGCDQSVRDRRGNTFAAYLDSWEYSYIQLRHKAWRIGKAHVHVFKATHSGYLAHEFTLEGKPLLNLIWEEDMGIETLERVLEAGVDLDDKWIRNSKPPPEYANVLVQYGWCPRGSCPPPGLSKYYPEELWTQQQREHTFTVRPINVAAVGVTGVTLVCISDTHWNHRKLHVPGGEILVCSGDLCMPWHKDLSDYIVWMGEQSHPHKVLVAGNHDKLIQNNREHYLDLCKQHGITYLEDSGCEILGLKFWGSPWTPKRPKNKNNAWTLTRPELMDKWNLIPSDTDVLVTHCPPYGIGDVNTEYYKGTPYQGGDFGLRKTINRLPDLKVHVFGHQHFGRGMFKSSNGVYFANCAIANDANAYVFT